MPDLTIASTIDPRDADMAIELTGRSAVICRVHEFVRRAAVSDGGVLITAERGCAVESLARELHARGRHRRGPFVTVDCASADVGVIDRTLFGAPAADEHADVEAIATVSRVAQARGGVLFLQNVAELPASAQSRLARIARDGEVRVDGATVETGFRLVAGATPGIDADVDARRFRFDLFRRLAIVRIDLPPLRDRQEDVPALAARLLDDVCAARAAAPRTFTQAALALIGALTWPGNLHELREVIDRVVLETTDPIVHVEHLLPALHLQRTHAAFTPSGNLREARLRFEREYIASVLQHHGWHMAEAAQTLGIQRPNLYRKARQLGIPLARAHE
jgi:two-component system, NtrC family, nitrogen regulation response regulator NtrX